jgi:hypothetical protein
MVEKKVLRKISGPKRERRNEQEDQESYTVRRFRI